MPNLFLIGLYCIEFLAFIFAGLLIERLLKIWIPEKQTQRYTIAFVIALFFLLGCGLITKVLIDRVNKEPIGTVTREEVKEWSVGATDKDTVYDIIYRDIHNIPGKRQFISNSTIPAGVLITTDLGDNWFQYPVIAVARNGGWGVFETTGSFKAPATGEYWLIEP